MGCPRNGLDARVDEEGRGRKGGRDVGRRDTGRKGDRAEGRARPGRPVGLPFRATSLEPRVARCSGFGVLCAGRGAGNSESWSSI